MTKAGDLLKQFEGDWTDNPESGGFTDPILKANNTPQSENPTAGWAAPQNEPSNEKPETNSNWDTDGYATPGYTATNFGNAPSGWDPVKWSNQNHQTPKYVVGRILTAAGDLRDPNKRNEAIANIQKAYPGAQFNGKDKISIDGGRSWVDIFGGASAGIYSPAWQDESSSSGASAPQTANLSSIRGSVDNLRNYATTMPMPAGSNPILKADPSINQSYVPPAGNIGPARMPGTPPVINDPAAPIDASAPPPVHGPGRQVADPAKPPRNNFSWGVHGVGKEGVDWGNTNNWTEQQWQEFEGTGGAGWSGGEPVSGPGPVINDPANPPAGGGGSAPPVNPRTNFSWGVHGHGQEGVDWGNTNNWTEQQWQDYEKKYGLTSPTPTAPAPAGGGGAPAGPAPKDPKTLLIEQLMQRMQQSLKIDGNDPIIKGQTDAFSANAERARRNLLADAAEGSSPYATGAQRGLERMTSERMGQQVGGFEAELIGRELTARRDEIRHAMDSMGSLLTEGERQSLQRELAQLDASIRRQQMDQQAAQFSAQLSQADRHFLDQLAQQGRFAEMDDAFRRMQLGQNDSQWRDQIGFNEQQERNKWDWLQRGNN